MAVKIKTHFGVIDICQTEVICNGKSSQKDSKPTEILVIVGCYGKQNQIRDKFQHDILKKENYSRGC